MQLRSALLELTRMCRSIGIRPHVRMRRLGVARRLALKVHRAPAREEETAAVLQPLDVRGGDFLDPLTTDLLDDLRPDHVQPVHRVHLFLGFRISGIRVIPAQTVRHAVRVTVNRCNLVRDPLEELHHVACEPCAARPVRERG
jgi:hypothetical protein